MNAGSAAARAVRGLLRLSSEVVGIQDIALRLVEIRKRREPPDVLDSRMRADHVRLAREDEDSQSFCVGLVTMGGYWCRQDPDEKQEDTLHEEPLCYMGLDCGSLLPLSVLQPAAERLCLISFSCSIGFPGSRLPGRKRQQAAAVQMNRIYNFRLVSKVHRRSSSLRRRVPSRRRSVPSGW